MSYRTVALIEFAIVIIETIITLIAVCSCEGKSKSHNGTCEYDGADYKKCLSLESQLEFYREENQRLMKCIEIKDEIIKQASKNGGQL